MSDFSGPGALVHLKGSAGVALCWLKEPSRSPALPGEWLVTFTEPFDVTCPVCREWIHA